jgi:hypothetical protein
VATISEIAAIAVDDGVVFSPDQAQPQTIREDDHYAGVRITMPAAIGQAQVKLALDINFGDPITPGAVRTDYPYCSPVKSSRYWPIRWRLCSPKKS